jgi:hypothetical protein
MGYESVSRSRKHIVGSLLGLGLVAAPLAATMAAEVTVGAGVRSSFSHFDGAEGTSFSEFTLDDARLYISGKVTDQIGVMFNTQLTQFNDDSDVNVLDAAATFDFGMDQHIWAGRFIAPSDRANLYGAFYANSWYSFVDGVQDQFPGHVGGRDEGVMWWGQFGMAKLSAGIFNNNFTTDGDLKAAVRAQYNFWDSEDGYYLNGSYYGAKDLLSVGIAGQWAGGDSVIALDALIEKKLGGGGVVTVEAEYSTSDFGQFSDDGWYVLGAYMFPQQIGWGKFQTLAKYGNVDNEMSDGEGGEIEDSRDTLELNLNYIIKDQNARIQMFYLDPDFGFKVYGVGVQVQL